MCGKIDCFVEAFSKLRIEEDRERWSAATTYRAPNKPFLLLAVLDLVEKGKITKGFIELTPDLEEAFNALWQKIIPDLPDRIAEPFYTMVNESFWTLVPRQGIEKPDAEFEYTLERFRELYLGARLDKDLFPLLLMEPLRRRLKGVLVKEYFGLDMQVYLGESKELP